MHPAVRVAFFRALLSPPDAVARVMAAGVPRELAGQRLGLRTRLLLRALALDPSPPEEADVATQRRAYRLVSDCWLGGPRLPTRTEDHRVGEVGLRAYHPPGPDHPRPGLVWMHGGGWVIGDLETHDRLCRRLACDLDAVVVSVDYRRAPEHPFPTPLDDALTAWTWVRTHAASLGIRADRLALGGDSAGGNMTAVLTRELPPSARPAVQVLAYPGTDFTCAMPSHARFADGFLLTEGLIHWFVQHYAGDHDRRDPRLSPLFAEDLGGQPTAVVVIAGLDPLQDEGRAYADRLERAGVRVLRQEGRGLVHGFLTMLGCLPEADEAVRTLTASLRPLLHAPAP